MQYIISVNVCQPVYGNIVDNLKFIEIIDKRKEKRTNVKPTDKFKIEKIIRKPAIKIETENKYVNKTQLSQVE